MYSKKKLGQVKSELQLRARPSLIDTLRKCSERQLKEEFSEYFDFMVSLTDTSEASEVALNKMMEKITINEESD